MHASAIQMHPRGQSFDARAIVPTLSAEQVCKFPLGKVRLDVAVGNNISSPMLTKMKQRVGASFGIQ